MSGLAQHLFGLGYDVSGSDRTESEETQALKKLGIKVFVGHNSANIDGAQLVVRTSAVPTSNEEVARALHLGVPVLLREQLLGVVFDSFENRIAVCGTHGKTTVTAMLHEILVAAGMEHAAFVGGLYRGNNFFAGTHTVIAEACEFNRSFLQLHPTVCVCLNAEHDHPDCYGDLEDVRRAFASFFQNVGKTGWIVLPSELKGLCPHKNRVLFDKIYTVGNLQLTEGKPCFDMVEPDNAKHRISLQVPGKHNVHNALAALAAAQVLGIPADVACTGLNRFVGVDRRWTELQIAGIGKTVLDYAHHPTEIACSVATAKSMTKGRVLCVFQPHTYTRTKAFWEGFSDCFKQADAVAYLPVYSAREKPIAGVNSYLLAQSAAAKGLNACFLTDFASARRWIFGNATEKDILLILGAGDINKLANQL